MDHHSYYRGRVEAGQQLLEMLKDSYAGRSDVVVLGLPRGGVVVAAEIARGLGAPLDVILVRKLGAPNNPELAIGAIAEGGVAMVNRGLIHHLEVPEGYLEDEISRQLELMEQRSRLYHHERPPAPLEDRVAILVDDGLATGSTAEVAIASARRQQPSHLVFAVPVASHSGMRRIQKLADEAVCPLIPEDLTAVGYYYERFEPVSDEEVIHLLSSQNASPS